MWQCSWTGKEQSSQFPLGNRPDLEVFFRRARQLRHSDQMCGKHGCELTLRSRDKDWEAQSSGLDYKKREGENSASWPSYSHWVLDWIGSHHAELLNELGVVMDAEVIWCVCILPYLRLAQLLYSALKIWDLVDALSSTVGKCMRGVQW